MTAEMNKKGCLYASDKMLTETSVAFLPKVHNLILIMRKCQTDPN